jgi:hypothetical protein
VKDGVSRATARIVACDAGELALSH